MRENNTNNYIERSFGILKDIVFTRTQAYNCVQVFQFVTLNMKRFYMRRLLSFAYRHLETYQIAKCFLYPEWENVDIDNIKKSNVKNEYFVTSIQDNNIIYIINYKIRICSYPIEI